MAEPTRIPLTIAARPRCYTDAFRQDMDDLAGGLARDIDTGSPGSFAAIAFEARETISAVSPDRIHSAWFGTGASGPDAACGLTGMAYDAFSRHLRSRLAPACIAAMHGGIDTLVPGAMARRYIMRTPTRLVAAPDFVILAHHDVGRKLDSEVATGFGDDPIHGSIIGIVTSRIKTAHDRIAMKPALASMCDTANAIFGGTEGRWTFVPPAIDQVDVKNTGY